MTIQEFSRQLEREGDLSPLLAAVQALCTCGLDQIRGPKDGLFAGWTVWEESGLAQTPQAYAAKAELRN